MLKYIKMLNKSKNNKCNCGDINCKREIISDKFGHYKVINHFTCGYVKKIIDKYKNLF